MKRSKRHATLLLAPSNLIVRLVRTEFWKHVAVSTKNWSRSLIVGSFPPNHANRVYSPDSTKKGASHMAGLVAVIVGWAYHNVPQNLDILDAVKRFFS